MDNFKGPRLPILFLLYAGDQRPICGAIRLQKMVFILKNEYKVAKRTFTAIKFVPHKFGMYSRDVQDDLIFLENIDLIGAKTSDRRFDFDYLMGEEDINRAVEYKLTKKGESFISELINEALASGPDSKQRMESILKACDDVKTKFNAVDIRDVLRYVYTKYPAYTAKSEILGEIMGGD